MIGSALATLIRRYSKTNSTTYTDPNLLVDINLVKDEIAGLIAAARNEAFNITKKEDLVGDQRTYLMDNDVMNNLVRVELMFDAGDDYVLAKPAQLAHKDVPIEDEANITLEYDNTDPQYFIRDRYIYILSGTIIAVTNGIKWVYKQFPDDLADLTGEAELAISSLTAIGFPREFQELWARKVSMGYKDENNIKYNNKELKYEIDLQTAIDNFAVPNINENTIGSLPVSDSDNGYEL